MNVTRQQYRAARRLFRQNGGYALQWMKPEVRLCIASTLVQPPLDQLECRAKHFKNAVYTMSPWNYQELHPATIYAVTLNLL